MRNTSLKQDNSRQNQRNIVIRDKLKNVIHSVNNNNLLLIYFTDKIQIKSMGINIQCKKRMYKNKKKNSNFLAPENVCNAVRKKTKKNIDKL